MDGREAVTATRIGIAVVEHDGWFLVGTRANGTVLAGYAEFPGGKCEPDESPEACAVRECLEESGLAVAPIKLIDQRSWEYPHGRIELWFFLCELSYTADSEPLPPFRWVHRDELRSLHFPEANAAVLDFIAGDPMS